MNEQWVYVGAATAGEQVALATARPKWSLYQTGRRPRGEWEPTLISLERRSLEDAVAWLSASAGDPRTPLGEGHNRTVLLDVSEMGGGDFLLRHVRRAVDRSRTLGQVRILALDVTPRDVERAGRTLARRDLLAPLMDAARRGVREIVPKGSLREEFRAQLKDVTRRPDVTPGTEDLVRAVALCAWAIDLEGQTAGTNEGLGVLNAY